MMYIFHAYYPAQQYVSLYNNKPNPAGYNMFLYMNLNNQNFSYNININIIQ